MTVVEWGQNLPWGLCKRPDELVEGEVCRREYVLNVPMYKKWYDKEYDPHYGQFVRGWRRRAVVFQFIITPARLELTAWPWASKEIGKNEVLY